MVPFVQGIVSPSVFDRVSRFGLMFTLLEGLAFDRYQYLPKIVIESDDCLAFSWH